MTDPVHQPPSASARRPRLTKFFPSGLRRRLALSIAGAMALVLILCGCETARFYTQAANGHWTILRNQKSIASLIASPASDPALVKKLRLILDLREFAHTNLLLPSNGHYLRYADLGSQYVVWNVYAAKEFSVEDHTWWYPFLGRLSYRGYFNPQTAQDYAATLRAEGMDVFVEGIEAYSTLGWFRDPVLNTFIHHDEPALAELLFHELAHQRVFVRGDTDFNEAFATAVAEEGVRRWLALSKDPSRLEKWSQAQSRQREFAHLVLQCRDRLDSLYQRQGSKDAEATALRTEKAALFQELRRDYNQLKARWNGYGGFDRWMTLPLNNAQLNTIATYYEMVPDFEKLLRCFEGELARFYAAVKSAGHKPKSQRAQSLKDLSHTP